MNPQVELMNPRWFSQIELTDLPAPRFASRLRAVEKTHKVDIGCRWVPTHRIIRDEERGTHSEINSPLISEAEQWVQKLMLAQMLPTRPTFWQRLLRRLRGGK